MESETRRWPIPRALALVVAAALAVRPATDNEITSMLPPARVGPGMVGRLKVLAKRVYGQWVEVTFPYSWISR